MGAAPRRIELRRLIEMLSRNLHEGPALSGRSTSVGYNVPVLQFPLLLAPTFAVGAISFAALAQTSNLLAQIGKLAFPCLGRSMACSLARACSRSFFLFISGQ
jgi:hypothetical protein